MPIVYIHGVAVRDEQGEQADKTGNTMLDQLLQNISWPMVEKNLRDIIAPELSAKPDEVSITQAYWGDLAATLAWDGASCIPERRPDTPTVLPFPAAMLRSFVASELRYPLNQLIARFMGDVFIYINNRGDAVAPGPIPKRILETLIEAHAVKERTGEPLVCLTNSMGCQIMYDIVTYFLPNTPQCSRVKIDYWCGVASQVGLFEELKLFLVSSPDYSRARGNRVPYPDRNHLGNWWNVWDMDDMISYSVAPIIEGVDDTPYRVGESLLKEHVGYLQEERFYKLFAERLREALRPRDSAASR
jgi:hypothetical protein